MTKCDCNETANIVNQLKTPRIIDICILDDSECCKNSKQFCCEDAGKRMPDLRVVVGWRGKRMKCLIIELKLCMKNISRIFKSDEDILKFWDDIYEKMKNARGCSEDLPVNYYYIVFSEDLQKMKEKLKKLSTFKRYSLKPLFGIDELKKEIMEGDC